MRLPGVGATTMLAATCIASAIFAVTDARASSPLRFAQNSASGAERPSWSRPIRLIVPYPAGGSVDTAGRVVAAELSNSLGQQIVVDNRPGANGIIGSDITAKAAPDGSTLLMQSVAHAINASLYSKLPYDSIRSFEFVGTLIAQPNIMVVHPSLSAASVGELVALAKAKPGAFSFASPGNGSAAHLSGELFKAMAGLDIVHVPYRGGPPALNDLMAGRVSMYFSAISFTLPLARSGKLKALAVTGSKRSPAAPDLPTVAEAIPGYEATTWYGVFAPAGTPKKIVGHLNDEIVKALRVPKVRDVLTASGAEIVGDTPAQFAARVKADIAKWGKVVKASGARVD